MRVMPAAALFAVAVTLFGCKRAASSTASSTSSATSDASGASSGPRVPPRPAPNASPRVVRSSNVACALYTDGALYCRDLRALSAKDLASHDDGSGFFRVDGLGALRTFDVGPLLGVAVREDGDVIAWPESPQVLTERFEPKSTRACEVHDAVDVSVSSAETAAILTRTGKVFKWKVDRLVPGCGAPAVATGIEDAVSVSCGFTLCCAAHRTGAVSCFAASEDDRGRMVRIPDLSGVAEVSVGQFEALARDRAGRVRSFSPSSYFSPTAMPNLSDGGRGRLLPAEGRPSEPFAELDGAAGLSSGGCGLDKKGAAVCARGSAATESLAALGDGLRQLDVSHSAPCALDASNEVVCAIERNGRFERVAVVP